MKNRKQVKTSFIRELKMLLAFTAFKIQNSKLKISPAHAQSWQWAKQKAMNGLIPVIAFEKIGI